ncbi:MAG: M15 family metallopeptidase [Chloroflexi bacterium]|nr:M15 family metallopeptidase [Chloroflexota bacterium]
MDSPRTVGGASARAHLPPVFVLAIGAFAVSFLVLVAVVAGAACGGDGGGQPTMGATGTSSPTGTAQATSSSAATPGESATAEPTAAGASATSAPGNFLPCGDIMAPLDKQNSLPENCAPNDLQALPASAAVGGQFLRAAAKEAILELFAAAEKEGFTLKVVSAYRSYQTQIDTFNFNVQQDGLAQAERTSARAGHSEHQLGTTADVASASVGYQLTESFGATPEGKWLAANSWKYGFIISYPQGSEGITGYAYEPWHIRWIGKSEAQKVKDSGLTLHDYLLKR